MKKAILLLVLIATVMLCAIAMAEEEWEKYEGPLGMTIKYPKAIIEASCHSSKDGYYNEYDRIDRFVPRAGQTSARMTCTLQSDPQFPFWEDDGYTKLEMDDSLLDQIENSMYKTLDMYMNPEGTEIVEELRMTYPINLEPTILFDIFLPADDPDGWRDVFESMLSTLEFPPLGEEFAGIRFDFYENVEKNASSEKIIVDEGAACYVLAFSGETSQFALEEVEWDDAAFRIVNVKTLFKADLMSDGDQLDISCFFPDGLPKLRIRWSDPWTKDRTYYLTMSGKDGSLHMLSASEILPPKLVGSWGTDGVTLRVLQSGDEYKVLANFGDGEYGWSRAVYNDCVYDEEEKELSCIGIEETCELDPETEDKEESERRYTMVKREDLLTLTIREDGIMEYPVWGEKPKELLYYGAYEGTWKDGDTIIDFHFGDTELWCDIEEDPENVWTYRCDYDEESNRPYEHFYGSRRNDDREEEREATFYIDGEGRLVWNDLSGKETRRFIRQEEPRDERIHDFYRYEPGDGKAYEVFVITQLLYDENRKVTDVTGQFAHIPDNDESSGWELAEDGKFYTYHLAEDFSADMLDNLYLFDSTMETVTDLHEWYIRVYLEGREPENGELQFPVHMSDEELKNADPDALFDYIPVKLELNEAGGIRYACYMRILWIM